MRLTLGQVVSVVYIYILRASSHTTLDSLILVPYMQYS